jgi:hypothetical protein
MSIGDIGGAVEAMRKGQKVRRAGWNGKGMWLELVPADMWEHGSSDGSMDANHVGVRLLPWTGMKTADNGFVPWLCSQTDLLATDWELAE